MLPSPSDQTGAARFTELYDSNYHRILGYARKRVAREDAADVVAETFTIAWRRLDDVPEGEATLFWLYATARRVLANQRRSERRRAALVATIEPADPAALYTHLKQEAASTDNPLPVEMFTLIGDALRETAATSAQRAALYQVAARLPGIELLGTVTDGVGRSGVGIAMTNHHMRATLILDPDTSVLLAEETTALAGNTYGYTVSIRTSYSTYLTQAIVNSEHATP